MTHDGERLQPRSKNKGKTKKKRKMEGPRHAPPSARHEEVRGLEGGTDVPRATTVSSRYTISPAPSPSSAVALESKIRNLDSLLRGKGEGSPLLPEEEDPFYQERQTRAALRKSEAELDALWDQVDMNRAYGRSLRAKGLPTRDAEDSLTLILADMRNKSTEVEALREKQLSLQRDIMHFRDAIMLMREDMKAIKAFEEGERRKADEDRRRAEAKERARTGPIELELERVRAVKEEGLRLRFECLNPSTKGAMLRRRGEVEAAMISEFKRLKGSDEVVTADDGTGKRTARLPVIAYHACKNADYWEPTHLVQVYGECRPGAGALIDPMEPPIQTLLGRMRIEVPEGTLKYRRHMGY